MISSIKKIAGYCEWISFAAFAAMLGIYAVKQASIWAAIIFFLAAGLMIVVMFTTASPKLSPKNRFPANIPVGNPMIFALLAYFGYEAWEYEPSWHPLMISVFIATAIGFLRWVVSLIND